MIKKLMSFIFEEEEVINDLDEAPQPRRTVGSKERTNEVSVPVQSIPLPKETRGNNLEKKQEEKVSEVVVKKEEKPISSLKKMTVNENQATKLPVKKVRPDGEEYEFAPVISPIFGVLGDKSTPVSSLPIKKKPIAQKSMLGTVISPYYGMEKPQDEDKVEEISQRIDEKINSEEELLSVSLDDLIMDSNNPIPMDDDSMQQEKVVIASQNLSLFDDEIEK